MESSEKMLVQLLAMPGFAFNLLLESSVAEPDAEKASQLLFFQSPIGVIELKASFPSEYRIITFNLLLESSTRSA